MATILIIDPTDSAPLQRSLAKEYGLTVKHLANGYAALDALQHAQPDLIVLNANLTTPPAESLLAELAARNMTIPVVLVGANGEMANFTYKNIVGWLNQPYVASELATLVQSALKSPLPTGELVLAKRAELIEANQKLTYRLQELQTLFEISKSVTSLLDLEAVLRRVVKSAIDLTGAEEGYLLLVDETSGDLYLRAQSNLGIQEAKDFRIKVKDSIAGQVVQTGQPITISHQQNDLKVKTGFTVYSLVNVPLRVGQNVIGVLGIDNRHKQQAFTHDDQQLLSALADWAAIAIQNARLYADAKELGRDLKLVNHVSRLISSTLDVEQIPRLLLRHTTEIFEAECGSLALVDRERAGVVFWVAYDGQGNELEGLKDFLMPLGEGVVGLVAKTGIPHIVNNVQQDPGWSPVADRLTGFTTQKIIAVPLVTEGEIIGVMELLNKKEGDFNDSDLQLLSLVASSAASAIQNARQYAALKRANETIRQAQAQRIAAERWAILGKAAANLAHRINNTTALVPIAAQQVGELLRDVALSAELKKEITDKLDRIKRNSLYTVDLASELLRRFRRNPIEAHNINELVKKALNQVELPENIRIVRHLDPDLPAVDTSDLLIDVFVELFTNAIRVMKDGGLLRIASFQSGNDQVSIQITDSGPGILEDDINHIFDIFYTTSPNGLGFGLWWVKTFLEQQGGEITVDSCPGEGTTFTVTLLCNPPPLHSW